MATAADQVGLESVLEQEKVLVEALRAVGSPSLHTKWSNQKRPRERCLQCEAVARADAGRPRTGLPGVAAGPLPRCPRRVGGRAGGALDDQEVIAGVGAQCRSPVEHGVAGFRCRRRLLCKWPYRTT